MPKCAICEGVMFCGKCEDEAREGDAFLLSMDREREEAEVR